MPTTITGIAGTYQNTASVPVDSDVASAASVQVPFQRLLDNEKVLFDLLNTGGTLAVRNVASIAALQALTGMVNKQVCVVTGVGFFVYVDPDATAAVANLIVAPTAGTGRWYSTLNSLKNVANGVVILDGTAKVPQAQLRGTFVSSASVGTAGANVVMTTATVTALTLAVAVQVGDVIVVNAPGMVKAATSPGAGDEPEVYLATSGATVTVAGPLGQLIVNTVGEPTGVACTYTATSTGTLTINLRMTPQGAIVGSTLFRGTTLRATVFRP